MLVVYTYSAAFLYVHCVHLFFYQLKKSSALKVYKRQSAAQFFSSPLHSLDMHDANAAKFQSLAESRILFLAPLAAA
jgi:hypothetical protein